MQLDQANLQKEIKLISKIFQKILTKADNRKFIYIKVNTKIREN